MLCEKSVVASLEKPHLIPHERSNNEYVDTSFTDGVVQPLQLQGAPTSSCSYTSYRPPNAVSSYSGGSSIELFPINYTAMKSSAEPPPRPGEGIIDEFPAYVPWKAEQRAEEDSLACSVCHKCRCSTCQKLCMYPGMRVCGLIDVQSRCDEACVETTTVCLPCVQKTARCPTINAARIEATAKAEAYTRAGATSKVEVYGADVVTRAANSATTAITKAATTAATTVITKSATTAATRAVTKTAITAITKVATKTATTAVTKAATKTALKAATTAATKAATTAATKAATKTAITAATIATTTAASTPRKTAEPEVSGGEPRTARVTSGKCRLRWLLCCICCPCPYCPVEDPAVCAAGCRGNVNVSGCECVDWEALRQNNRHRAKIAATAVLSSRDQRRCRDYHYYIRRKPDMAGTSTTTAIAAADKFTADEENTGTAAADNRSKLRKFLRF